MINHCDLHNENIDRRGCPWCRIEELEKSAELFTSDKLQLSKVCRKNAAKEIIEICFELLNATTASVLSLAIKKKFGLEI